MTAIEDIHAERRRQIEVEGWSPQHDADHEPGHLLRAGVLYLWHGTDKEAPVEPNGAPLSWPWEPEWWKPKDRRSNLIRAGALMLAERDAILTRHRGNLAAQAGQTFRRRWFVNAPHTGHVEHKLQIVLREIDALDATSTGGPDG